MSRTAGSTRPLLTGIISLALLSGCQSVPATGVPLPPTSSLLAVDVLFPAPFARDPSLVQVFFLKGPVLDGPEDLPELIPASFVKSSRAYLLDPEPGAYSVVAVTAEYAPPSNERPIAGVTRTTWSGTSSDAMVFPAEWIRRTTTTVSPGAVAFVGVLRVRRGDHINANAAPQDALQKRIAERVRPGVTSESGLSGWLKRTRTIELEKTSLSNQPADREAFFVAALADLGDSPWAGVIPRKAASRELPIARATPPARRLGSPSKSVAKSEVKGAAPSPPPIPRAAAAPPQPTVAEPQIPELQIVEPRVPEPQDLEPPAAEPLAAERQIAEPQPAPVEVEPVAVATAALPEPEPLSLAPEPHPFPGVPPDSVLARIEFGMKHDEVQRILGSPDGRIDRLTAKAWIPFYNGPGANLRDWIYEGRGRVVFSLYEGSLEVVDVVYDPNQRK